jgi:hypothetical protein
MDDYKIGWNRLNRASTDQASVNTAVLAYSGTWATAAQNPAVWPTTAKNIPEGAEGILLFFAVADTAGDSVTAKIWLKPKKGPPIDAITCSLIVAGTSVVSTDPCTGDALTNFFYADAITLSTSVCNVAYNYYGNTDNGIASIKISARPWDQILCDFDCDAGGGTDGTDGICYWLWT